MLTQADRHNKISKAKVLGTVPESSLVLRIGVWLVLLLSVVLEILILGRVVVLSFLIP